MKSQESDRLSEYKSFTTTQVQIDDPSFWKNALSRSLQKFSDLRETSGKSHGKRKSKKVATLYKG